MKRFLRIGGEAFDQSDLMGWSIPDDNPRARDKRNKVRLYFDGGNSRELTLTEAELAAFRAWAESESTDLTQPAPG